MSVKENLENIQSKVSEAVKKSGRTEGSVRLMAVSKFHSVEEIAQTIENGQFLFGENRVQEANEKFPSLMEKYNNIELHMIGQLQSNKVRNIVKIANCIESVDRFELLQEIEKQCSKINKCIDVLFEIHTGEESKSGFTSEDELLRTLEACESNLFPHINPSGFMTMAPFTEDEGIIRKSFVTLREISEKMKKQFSLLKLNELSMGMSNDFEIAIEEGSTIVRVGTAIFGKRDYSK